MDCHGVRADLENRRPIRLSVARPDVLPDPPERQIDIGEVSAFKRTQSIEPPFELKEFLDHRRFEAIADDARRHAADDRIRWHIPRHNRTGPDYGAITDRHAATDESALANPDIIADLHRHK